jgi:hypothetical protein
MTSFPGRSGPARLPFPQQRKYHVLVVVNGGCARLDPGSLVSSMVPFA